MRRSDFIVANKKRNKSKTIKRGDEYMVVKNCSCCGIEFEQARPSNAYCEDCRKILYKIWTNKRKKNAIYIFKPVFEEYEGQLIYIGSTDNIATRMSDHLYGHSAVSKKVDDKMFDIYYTEVAGVNREELYFIEYYLIDKYKEIYGDKPIGNEVDTYNIENIPTSRQAELMLLADNLEFDIKYDVRRHRIKEYCDNSGRYFDIVKKLSQATN
jgi:predicted GIY-YIG superfamily endonuclease